MREARSERARDKMIQYDDDDYCYCDNDSKKEVCFALEVDMTLTSANETRPMIQQSKWAPTF